MPLVKLIIPKRINVLGVFRFLFSLLLTAVFVPGISQDNSPYSRYGLGDIVPSTNVNSRAMGGISAGYLDLLSINYNNPATYGSFLATKEALSNKLANGRAILDVGINLENRTLREPGNVEKFTANNFLFSHVQVGIPIRKNWGLSFGLRPVNRISYKIFNRELLHDPNSGLPIDTAVTLYQGDGGAYLASMGTGFKINLGQNTSVALGVNGGYLFGKKDYSTRRTILNDSLLYNSGNFETKTTYGNLYGNAGLQFQHWFNKAVYISLGAYGNWKQTLNATQDIYRETYTYDDNSGYVRRDSVYDQTDIKGKVIYPSSYTFGFVIEKTLYDVKKNSWLFGVDFSQTKWSEYQFYGQADPSVKDNWQVRVGGQFRPISKQNYFSNVAYRAGFSFGPDYINVNNKLPLTNISFGFGLPVFNRSRLTEYQTTILNLGIEYIRRGNNNNLLKENMFRLSVGFSLSDIWFVKRKYE